jgi:hypothetical protein
MHLAKAGGDVPGTLRNNCTGFVIVGLIEETAAWIDISPATRCE